MDTLTPVHARREQVDSFISLDPRANMELTEDFPRHVITITENKELASSCIAFPKSIKVDAVNDGEGKHHSLDGGLLIPKGPRKTTNILPENGIKISKGCRISDMDQQLESVEHVCQKEEQVDSFIDLAPRGTESFDDYPSRIITITETKELPSSCVSTPQHIKVNVVNNSKSNNSMDEVMQKLQNLDKVAVTPSQKDKNIPDVYNSSDVFEKVEATLSQQILSLLGFEGRHDIMANIQRRNSVNIIESDDGKVTISGSLMSILKSKRAIVTQLRNLGKDVMEECEPSTDVGVMCNLHSPSGHFTSSLGLDRTARRYHLVLSQPLSPEPPPPRKRPRRQGRSGIGQRKNLSPVKPSLKDIKPNLKNFDSNSDVLCGSDGHNTIVLTSDSKEDIEHKPLSTSLHCLDSCSPNFQCSAKGNFLTNEINDSKLMSSMRNLSTNLRQTDGDGVIPNTYSKGYPQKLPNKVFQCRPSSPNNIHFSGPANVEKEGIENPTLLKVKQEVVPECDGEPDSTFNIKTTLRTGKKGCSDYLIPKIIRQNRGIPSETLKRNNKENVAVQDTEEEYSGEIHNLSARDLVSPSTEDMALTVSKPCVSQVNKFSEVWVKSEEDSFAVNKEEKPKIEYKFSCNICSYKSMRENHYIKHMRLHDKVQTLFHCDDCNFVSIRLSHLRRHKMSHAQETLHCSHCTYTCDDHKLLAKHMRVKHFPAVKQNEEESGAALEEYKCEECAYKTSWFYAFQRHQRSHFSNKVVVFHTCPQCSYKTARREHFLRHINNVHQNHRPYLCDVCGKAFKRQDALKQHHVTHYQQHGDSDRVAASCIGYVCHVCKKVCRSSAYLKEHMATHSEERSFLCEICGASFKTRSVQRNHVQTIHRHPRAFHCSVCHKKFNTKFALRRHMKQHTGGTENRNFAKDIQVCVQKIESSVIVSGCDSVTSSSNISSTTTTSAVQSLTSPSSGVHSCHPVTNVSSSTGETTPSSSAYQITIDGQPAFIIPRMEAEPTIIETDNPVVEAETDALLVGSSHDTIEDPSNPSALAVPSAVHVINSDILTENGGELVLSDTSFTASRSRASTGNITSYVTTAQDSSALLYLSNFS
ncbi:uncharacterized protein LOC143041515 isoform X2 [Oratosquilla oratoria]|uniref:uncharacterized protein LOC143041515 isoform X2 n=1 Tax=Oratosquilla oratoria TaxID=337810 RepID=UPI003F761A7D